VLLSRTALALATLALTACQVTAPTPADNPDTPPDDRPVRLVATAPDGTQLWHVYDWDNHENVYFASTGAQWEVRCGKHCRRDVRVPTADPLEAAAQ
jgi:hypothetical protein